MNFPDFLAEPADTVAELLLGCEFERTIEGEVLRVRIVETEAYDEDDPASHAFNGPTASNAALFGESGQLYVYFTYGMHHCCNVVCREVGYGAGALIRAAEPLDGLAQMERRRGRSGRELTNGPGKLCQALGVDRSLTHHDLRLTPMRLLGGSLSPGESVTRTTRIGITRAVDRPRRFYITDNPYVSRKATR